MKCSLFKLLLPNDLGIWPAYQPKHAAKRQPSQLVMVSLCQKDKLQREL